MNVFTVRISIILLVCFIGSACSKVEQNEFSESPFQSSTENASSPDFQNEDLQASENDSSEDEIDADDSAGSPDDLPMDLVDSTPPLLSLIMPHDEALEVDPCVGFNDPGAELVDNVDEARTVYADISGIDFRIGSPSSFEITYTGSDQAGNAAAPITRTLIIPQTGITNSQELVAIGQDLGASYKLCNDIDIIGNWIPLGGFGPNPTAFTGSLTGEKEANEVYKIRGLKIVNTSSMNSVGFFGALENANIEKIEFENVEIESAAPNSAPSSYAGSLAARAQNSLISDIVLSGSLKAKAHMVGGLVGFAQFGTQIENIRSTTLLVSDLINSGSLNSSSPCYNSFYGALIIACLGGVVGRAQPNVQMKNITLGSFPYEDMSTNNCSDLEENKIKVCNLGSSVNIQALGGLVGLYEGADTGLIKDSEFHGSVQNTASGSSSRSTGGIAGISTGRIESALVSGLVYKPSYYFWSSTGGISGFHLGSGNQEITLSGNYARVQGAAHVGGIAGCLGNHYSQTCFQSLSSSRTNGNISRSFSSSESIQALSSNGVAVGGLVGLVHAGYITESFSENTSVESGNAQSGGIAGTLRYYSGGYRGVIRDSYVRLSSISANYNSAGIAGQAYNSSAAEFAISRTYSLANVSSTQGDWDSTGGIVGNPSNNTIDEYEGEKNSFWLKTAGTNPNVPEHNDDGIAIEDYNDFLFPGLYTNAGWSPQVWKMPAAEPALPQLKWEETFDFPEASAQ